MPEPARPMLRRWQLGNALRRLREERGMTIAEVTAAMKERYGSSFSSAKLSRMETAKRGAIPRDVHDLCVLYAVPDIEREQLVALAQSTREFDKLSSSEATVRQEYSMYLALEQAAQRAREYTSMYIPGLLQTEAYATLIEDLAYVSPQYYNVREEDIPETTTGRVQLRLERQSAILRDNPMHLHTIIDENALHRRLAQPEIMRDQLLHLIEMSHRPNISIQVMPFESGIYPGAESAYWAVLDLPAQDGGPLRTAYIEAARGPILFDREADVNGLLAAFETLTKLALDHERSRDLIRRVSETHHP